MSTATGVIDFWSDPWGNTFKALQQSARELSTSVLPTVTKATLPDLNADWFLRAYAVTFALAVFLAVVLLLPQLIRAARGVLSGRELLDSIAIYFPLFLIGSMFGPPFGAVLVRFFSALSDSIISWGITSTAGTVTDRFQAMLSAQDAAGIAGGAPVADLLVVLILLGLLLVVVMLIVQLVTLYFTGVLLPLGLVWLIDPARRRFGTRIVSLWIGLLAAHPLLYLLLSVAYLMVSGNIDAFGDQASLQKTVTLIVALLSLFIAGLSPIALMRLAPVMLSGAGSAGAGVSLPPIGLRSVTDASTHFENQEDAPTEAGGTRQITSGASSTAETPSGPSIAQRATASPDSSPEAPPRTAASEATASPGETSPAVSAPPASTPPSGADLAPRTSATGSTSATAAPAAAEGTSGAVASTEGATVAAGAGESATGLGAVIGIPTIVAGLGLAGARTARRVGDQVIEKAAAPVEDGQRVGTDRINE